MSQAIFDNGVAPSTPAAGTVTVYSKAADKLLYYKDDAGVEHNITQGSASETFSVAPAVAAAHAVRSDQLSADNTNFPIYTPLTTWVPNQGAGLTVVGTFYSGGTYVRIGHLVFVTGYVQGSTSVACSSNEILCSNLPFTCGSLLAVGSAADTNVIGGSVVIGASTTSIYAFPGHAATSTIYFSGVYYTP